MHRDTRISRSLTTRMYSLQQVRRFEDFRDSLCNRTSENLSIPEYRLFIFGVSGPFTEPLGLSALYLIVS